MRSYCTPIAVALCLLGMALPPAQSQGMRERLKGLVYEVEDYTTPRDAWRENVTSKDRWNLWSTEEDVFRKRSNGRSLQSPRVEKDRATPEEGAPPLYTRITGIPNGTYRAIVSAPNRRIAISLDGTNWERHEGGEIELGVFTIKDGTFEVWADDRYATPDNIGSCYYDYIRFEEFTPPKFSHFAAAPVGDAYERLLGAGAPLPGQAGVTQLCWITDQPLATGMVEFGQGGRFDRRAESNERGLRNHRVTLGHLAPGRYQARVRVPMGRQSCVSPVFSFTVQAAAQQARSRALRVPLTVSEPTSAGRKQWPVTSGVPYAQGALHSADAVRLLDSAGRPVPARCTASSRWPDGSVRWLNVTFLADTDPARPTRYTLVSGVPEAARPAPKPVPVRVNAAADAKAFALFQNLALDANGDGRFAPTEVMTGTPETGNARLVDPAGKAWGASPEATVRRFENPLRREVIAEGSYAVPEGANPFRWRAEMSTFAGQPWMRLRFSVQNAGTKDLVTLLGSAGLRLPLAGSGPLEGSFDGRTYRPVADEDSFVLLQDKDDRFTLKAGGAETTGKHALGFASARRDGKRVTVFVRDFWQTYPKGLAIKPDGLHIRLLPPLPEDAYAKESEDGEALVRLWYPYKRGKYQFRRGLEFTTEMYVLLDGASGDPAQLERYAAWFQNPLVAAAAPAVYCDSGVLGPVKPRVPGQFNAYEEMVERSFAKIEEAREKKREYGWMNYGDWHGERHFNWGNQEYDLQWALGLEYLRTGDPKFLWRGEQAARHTVTIDTIHVPWYERMSGLVYIHSVGHAGGFFEQNDERFRKLGNVFGLANPEGNNPFVGGAIDAGGHIFQPGNLLYAQLLGDPRFMEVAERVVGNQAAYMTPNFRFGIERAAGWPLINAMEVYETTGDPFFLNAAHLYVERIVAQQDPEIGDFRMQHGPPECLHTPRHVGGKAFATGILLFGLMRYHMVTDDPAVKTCIVRSARWLARDSWNPRTHGFRYISTCPTFDRAGWIPLLVAPGMAYSLTLQPDEQVKSVLLDALSRGLRTTAPNGKSYAQDTRQTAHALALLQRLGVKELPEPQDVPTVQARGEVLSAPGQTAPLTILITRTDRERVPFTAEVRSLPRGWSASAPRVQQEVGGGTTAVQALRLAAGPDAAPGEGVVACTLAGKPAGEVRVRLVPRAPEVLPPAANASGLGVIGAEKNPTVQALASVPGVQVGISANDITRYRAVALSADYFARAEGGDPAELFARLTAYARGGGVVVLFQLNDDMWRPEYLPYDLVLSDTNGEMGKVMVQDHPLFAGVSALQRVVCYDTVTYAGPEWKVLARDGANGAAVAEAAVGKGKILILEPSFDRVAAGTETPPDGASAADCKRLLENLVRYATAR